MKYQLLKPYGPIAIGTESHMVGMHSVYFNHGDYSIVVPTEEGLRDGFIAEVEEKEFTRTDMLTFANFRQPYPVFMNNQEAFESWLTQHNETNQQTVRAAPSQSGGEEPKPSKCPHCGLSESCLLGRINPSDRKFSKPCPKRPVPPPPKNWDQGLAQWEEAWSKS